MQALRRAPRFVWMQRDFYHAFFGWKTALTFGYGIIEQGIKVVVPTVFLLYASRSKISTKYNQTRILWENFAR